MKKSYLFNCRVVFLKLEIGNIKGLLHSKMGTIKDRKSRDLVYTEEIK